jgi:serine/threonine protein kinase
LLEGGTLGDRIKKAPLSPVETVELGIAMAGALGRLHQAEILHRDVKPTNIGYDGDGNPKLMDFGIARAVLDLDDLSDLDDPSTEDDDPLGLAFPSPGEAGEPSLPITRRRFAGTLSYLSPEAVDGDPPDSSFDLWALGVVLYECLLGRKVLAAASKLTARIRQGRAPTSTSLKADPRWAELSGAACTSRPRAAQPAYHLRPAARLARLFQRPSLRNPYEEAGRVGDCPPCRTPYQGPPISVNGLVLVATPTPSPSGRTTASSCGCIMR